MEQISIPEYIDSPPQFLFLEMDDLFPLAAGLGAGLIVDIIMHASLFWFIGCVVGAVLTRIYIGFKRNRLPGTLKAFLYFHTGLFPINKKWTTGFLRRTDE
ncbi:MAG: hypothetical protein IJ881_08750 [Neisseriaceae bacterium]|nr:hypothetical protein [Neisseriaceae bacterium]MBR3425862.1 hypothetical protein [Neisseriaceae bacterium]